MNSEYFSHVPVLSAAMQLTSGPVLELGAGYGSTLLLHGLCASMHREIVTLESDEDWLREFVKFGRRWHTFKHVSSFDNLKEYTNDWGLVFVDHGIAKQRGISVASIANFQMLVAHDTCHHWLYDYEPALSSFKYRWDYKLNQPYTTVVSNVLNVAYEFVKIGL